MAEVRGSEVIKGVYLVRPESYPDERGRFVEIFRRDWVPGAREMVQVNRSESRAGVLRGMHYHLFQADYWYVTSGHAFIALFDFRGASPTAERTETFEIKDGDDIGVYIPPGVAHGFYAISDTTLVYMVDQYFDGTDELGIHWEDPSLEIPWPEGPKIISERDQGCPPLADVTEENLPL